MLGAKSHSPRSRGKLPSTLQDFGDKSPYSTTNANPSTGSHSRSPTGMSKEENYSNHLDSFTSLFSMTMSVMTTDTTFVEEQLAEMAHVIAKLTKIVKEKDMQIAYLINKVEAQVQNTGESSQGLNHLPNVASPLNDMELSITNNGSKKDLTVNQQRERHDGKMSDKTSKKPI